MNKSQILGLVALAGLFVTTDLIVGNIAFAQPYARPAQVDPTIAFATAAGDQYKIHYAYAGNSGKSGIIFLHGTPGSWPAFEVYLSNKSLQNDYFMVSVDRLGWGKSSFEKAAPGSSNKAQPKTPAFSLQARSIATIMHLYPEKKWLLVGHSLGSSIAPKIALAEDQRVTGMLLLAGSLDPKLGYPRWYNRVASTMLVKWLLPPELNYSNDEIMALRQELKELEVELSGRQLTTEVVIMQGMKDRLVSPGNPDYVMKNWPKSFKNLRSIEVPEAGHFLPWEQTELVIETIRQFNF